MSVGFLEILVLLTVLLSIMPLATERWGILGSDWESLRKRHRRWIVRAQDDSSSDVYSSDHVKMLKPPSTAEIIHYSGNIMLAQIWGFFLVSELFFRVNTRFHVISLRMLPIWAYVIGILVMLIVAVLATHSVVSSINEDIRYYQLREKWDQEKSRTSQTDE